jgi:hypothetical protein
MNIHPDTVRLSTCKICLDYPGKWHAQKLKYGNKYYPEYFNMPVSNKDFLYIVPVLYGILSENKISYFEIPEDIISQVKSNKGKIMFDYSHEYYNIDIMNKLHKLGKTWATNALELFINTIKRYDLSKSQVIVATLNKNEAANQNPYFTSTTVMWTEQEYSTDLNKTYLSQNKKLAEQKAFRRYRFISTMAECRPFRLSIAKHIYDNSYRDNNLVSLFHSLPDKTDDFTKSLPWILDMQTRIPLHKDGHKYQITSEIQNYYLDTYMDFCVDTTMMDSELFNNTDQCTEKVFRPIIAQKPFMLCSHKGALGYLHDLGYKTFSHLWDESYDNQSETDRLNSLLKLYDQFNQCSDTELAEICYKAMSIVEHNYYKYLENLENKHWLRYFNI